MWRPWQAARLKTPCRLRAISIPSHNRARVSERFGALPQFPCIARDYFNPPWRGLVDHQMRRIEE